MLTEADFAAATSPVMAGRPGPRVARRRRGRRAAALGTVVMTGVGLGAWGLGAPTVAQLPALDDPGSYTTTAMGAHVVVFSRPIAPAAAAPWTTGRTTVHTETHSDTVTDSVTDSGGAPDKRGGDGAGSSDGDGADSSGGSVFSPRVMDGPDGSATITNSGSDGTSTLRNGRSGRDGSGGHDGAGGHGGAGGTGGTGGTASGGSGNGSADGVSAPVSGAAGVTQLASPVFPPLQTVNGTAAEPLPSSATVSGSSAISGQQSSGAVSGPVAPSVSSPVSTPALQSAGNPAGSGAGGGGVFPAAVAQPAMMLMQVQCPTQMPAGSLCLEAINGSGAPAALTTPQAAPSLPLATSPGTAAASCPITGEASPGSAGGDSGAGDSGAGDSGAGAGGDSSSSDSSGDDSDSGGKKHHSSHKGKDGTEAIINPPPNEPIRPPGPITQGDRCDVGGASGSTS